MPKTKQQEDQDITPTTTEASPAVPAGGGGLTADVYADDRRVTEEAAGINQDWDEFHRVPDEALTPEARQAMQEGQQRLDEEARQRQENADAASNPQAVSIEDDPRSNQTSDTEG